MPITDRELPQIGTSSYVSTTSPAMGMTDAISAVARRINPEEWMMNAVGRFVNHPPVEPKPNPKEEQMPDQINRRLVQVFIADPDQNVPLQHALLYSGDQQLTDLSDQELFFEIDMTGILKKHNELRMTLVDKSVKDKTTYLEPVRIRDLKMTVVTIAAF